MNDRLRLMREETPNPIGPVAKLRLMESHPELGFTENQLVHVLVRELAATGVPDSSEQAGIVAKILEAELW